MNKTTYRSRFTVTLKSILTTAGFVLNAATHAEPNPTAVAQLSQMSIEELGNIEISSVSKHTERLMDAAASVYVITSEDIRRSGATSIPEILRLAPNLEVAQVNASEYAISARGFNSTTANKLLVLIDGRSVYTPLYSGVFWDAQDTLVEDIERIEVISGAGGTLWGANAVNGVINIITKNTRDTTGALVSVGTGNDKSEWGARYGGDLGEDGTYRVYAKRFAIDNTVTANYSSAQDAWSKGQLGFRMDWDKSNQTFLLEGEAYDGSGDQPVFPDTSLSGMHLLARWNKTLDDSSELQVQTYYDQTKRNYPGAFGETLDTYDLDVQYRLGQTGSHDITWGGGYRYSHDSVTNSAVLAFLPADRDLSLSNVFVQDNIALTEQLKLTLGIKLERNSYTGLENQPNVRLAWKPSDNHLLWSSIARAVRTPSRIDRDFYSPSSPPFLLAGGPDFQSEKLTAYEVGYRATPSAKTTFSISAFYNVYDQLRSLELSGSQYVLGNLMEGYTHGIETWGSYNVNDWWQLKAGYTYLQQNLHLKPDSTDPIGPSAAGNDPSHQFSLRSLMNLSHGLELDMALRAVGKLPNPSLPGYVVLDSRLGWKFSRALELSLSVTNLFNDRHQEFGTLPTGSVIGRAVYAKALWKF